MKNKLKYYFLGIAAGGIAISSILGLGRALYQQKGIIKNIIRSHSLSDLKPALNPQTSLAQNTAEIKIIVNPQRELGKINPLIYGSNLEIKMESEPDIIEFAKDIGIRCFRFPGGHQGYHWKTGTFDFDSRCKDAPLRNMDYLIEFSKRINAKLIMQVNVESGSADEAAQWVSYMNKKANFPVEYWELGNEVYGDWDKGHMSADKYAQTIKEYAQAMKQVDPAIKIGMDWLPKRNEGFNIEVIKKAADAIDFISCHWYPNHIKKDHIFEGRTHPTAKEVMGNYLQIPLIVKDAEAIISNYAPQRKGKIEITFLEWDGAWDGPSSDPAPYSQGIAQWSLANAIFYADCLGQFAQNGISASAHYDFQSIGFGLIRGWDRYAGWGGERWDGEIIRPKALAIKLFSQNFGDIFIESKVENSPSYYKKQDWWTGSYTGEVPYISCYASKFSDKKKLSLALINKNETEPLKVKIYLNSIGLKKEGKLLVLTADDLMAQNEGSPQRVKIKNFKIENVASEFTHTLPAHSVNILELDYE